ncbi:MAG: hypothetical protein AMXMBFR13_27770 [Phycisphaerae bacterium]
MAARPGFKSFPVQENAPLLTVCRYVERNALRADLVGRAEQWAWGSLCKRSLPPASRPSWLPALFDWPVRPPRDWTACVNRAQTPQENEAIRRSIRRGTPFGEESWQRRTAVKLGLESTLRPIGRPRKSNDDER